MLGDFLLYTAIALNKFICFFKCNNLKILIQMYLLRFESSIKYKTIEVFKIRILDKKLPFSKNVLNY